MISIQSALDGKFYKPSEILTVLNMAVSEDMLKGNNKGIKYYNIPCAFDIEVTSFYLDNGCVVDYKTYRQKKDSDLIGYNPDKKACMYIWQFGINGLVIIGRTWEEFFTMLDTIAQTLHLSNNKRLAVYVHNLGYEYDFMRKWIKFDTVFAVDVHMPLYAITHHFIEFRCSWKLSNYSLANLCSQLQTFKIKKLVGDLDYQILRNSATVLTRNELAYCVNDVLIVMCYIQEQINSENDIANMVLTQTGKVRRHCRNKTLYTNGHYINRKYHQLVHSLNFSSLEEFNLASACFQGGFTHANAYYSCDTLEDVASYDFTSSYPYVMVSEKFPMSSGVKVEITSAEQFHYFITNYACIMDIEFIGLIQRETHEHPLSLSKCGNGKAISDDKVIDNGRVVSCSWCRTCITNVDFVTFKQFYHWKDIKVNNFYYYHVQYLPTLLVQPIIELYGDKTQLKGVKGSEAEYLRSKEMVNSIYGMCATNPLRKEITIDDYDMWTVRELSEMEKLAALMKHNRSYNRFLFYLWGVFVTAYARRNLFTAIGALGYDYVYSDTDSVKVLHHEQHKDYFDAYNALVKQKLCKAAEYHGVTPSVFSPKTIKGVEKTLGVWDYECTYRRFKTLGAKRYCVEFADESDYPIIDGVRYPISITVSGLNKYKAIPYIYDILAGKDTSRVFEMFADGLHIPPDYTGKPLLQYSDDEIQGVLVDYQGHSAPYHEKSFIHMENSSYDLSLARVYINHINNVHDIMISGYGSATV